MRGPGLWVSGMRLRKGRGREGREGVERTNDQTIRTGRTTPHAAMCTPLQAAPKRQSGTDDERDSPQKTGVHAPACASSATANNPPHVSAHA